MHNRSYLRPALSTLAFVIGLASTAGCSGDEPSGGDADTAVVAPPPAAASAAETSPATTSADTVTVAKDDIKSDVGQPRITEFRFFGRPEGFPTYKAHLVSTLSHLFQAIVLENPTGKEVLVEVKGELQGFTSSPGSVTVTLAAGEKKTITLDPTLDYEALGQVSAPVAASFAVSLSVDGKVVSSGAKSTNVLPKNTVFWNAAGKTGIDPTEANVAIAILTTPHDKAQAIDSLLRDAATRSKFGAMLGYQYQASVPADQHYLAAIDQLSAIYTELKERGMNYTSVTTSFFAGGQNVRFPTESLEVQSANCIDGSLVFAAAAEAIGMHPVVFVVPGHALVAVRAGEVGTPAYEQLIPVETTELSRKNFQEAMQIGLARIKATPAEKTLRVDIEKNRKAKILPSPFPF